MSRRNTKYLDFNITSGAPAATKITCAELGKRSHGVAVAGDDNRNVRLWRISKPDSILCFQGHTSDITTVAFGFQEEEVYSGSFGGTVIVWDLNSQRAVSSLKGHMAACTTVASFPNQQQTFLATGAEDCNIKIWDLRRKACIQTFKGHQGPVRCVKFSPDSRWVASAGDDGTIKIWDLTNARKLADMSLGASPVTCMQFNPQDLSLAAGYQDRTVKYWDLENFVMISQTSPEATAIQSVCFEPEDGIYLFSASNESLKCWDLEQSELKDTIESSWRGVQDMSVNPKDNVLFGLTSYMSAFSLWFTPLEQVNFDGAPPEEEKVPTVESRVSKPLKPVRPAFNASFIPAGGEAPVGIDLNEFIKDPDPVKSDDISLINETLEGSDKVLQVLQRRHESINLVLNWWNNGNLTATINALNMMTDPSVTVDVLSNCIVENQIGNLVLENVTSILPLAQGLIESKYESHIRVGIQTVQILLDQFKNVISSTLTAPAGIGVDLSREERLRKCETCLSAFQAVNECNGLTKNSQRKNNTGEMAKDLLRKLGVFIWECGKR